MRPCLLIICIALLVAGARPARAQSAEELFHRGRAAYLDADFERAVELLERAASATRDAGLLARIQLHLGVNLAVLGQGPRADQAFRAALSQDPTLTLDPARFKASVIQRFQQVRSRLKGRLVVTADRPDAIVLVDGTRMGPAPLRARLEIGTHRVKVRCASAGPGFRYTETVLLAPDQEVRVTARLGGPATRPTQPAHRRERREHREPRRRIWTWVAAGGAVAALGTAIGLHLSARADYGDYEVTYPLGERNALRETIERKTTAAYALYGVGGALAAASALLFWLEGRAADRPASDSGIAVGLTPGGAVLGGRF